MPVCEVQHTDEPVSEVFVNFLHGKGLPDLCVHPAIVIYSKDGSQVICHIVPSEAKGHVPYIKVVSK